MLLRDSFNREFSYLRLSLTEACNFRCMYCLPNGYCRTSLESNLNPVEIRRLLAAFSELGICKLRLTGGEPMLRSDLYEILDIASKQIGINKIAITTNGFRLAKQVRRLCDSGLNAINVSIDSLNRETFKKITGEDCLPDVLEGIYKALEQGFITVKINTVLLKGVNEKDIEPLINLAKQAPLEVRFIELMKTSDMDSPSREGFFDEFNISSKTLRTKLLDSNWIPKTPVRGDGPASVFSHPDYIGSVGIIAPYSKDFCQSCNRLRVSSKGKLHLCLFTEGFHPLRELLVSDSQKEELKELLVNLVNRKEISHYLHDGFSGSTSNLSTIGG